MFFSLNHKNMKSLIFLLFATLILFIGCQNSKNPSLDITYIANEGFMLESSSKKILIDALFNNRYNFYAAPSENIRKKIIEDEYPFDKIDIMFVTHMHGDHFNAPLVKDFLNQNPETQFISPKQVSEILRSQANFNIQLNELFLKIGESIDTVIKKIPMKIIRLVHVGDYSSNTENFCFLINLDGIKILHFGDATVNFDENKTYLENLDLKKEKIDILFLEYFDNSEITRNYVMEIIRPKYIIYMHIPPTQIFSIIKDLNNINDSDFPETIIFKGSMEKMKFQMKGDQINVDTLNTVPVVKNPVKDICVLKNDPFQFTIPVNTFYISGNEPLSLSATLSNDKKLPNWITFDEASSTFTGSINQEQLIKIKLIATENDGDKAIDEFELKITDLYPGLNNLSDLKKGLRYKYYKGEWDSLPDFSKIKPVKTGITQQFNIDNSLKEDNFGYLFKGYINIKTEGVYCFYLRSDDGSKLYIGDNLIVDNDRLHDNRIELNGCLGLKKGKHQIIVSFFEKGGEQSLEVSYEGPGIEKQIVPGKVLFY